MKEDAVDDSTPLRDLYAKVQSLMPFQKDLEPLLEMDGDEKKVISYPQMKIEALTEGKPTTPLLYIHFKLLKLLQPFRIC
jgi:hypothetical protein